jgi:uncharacterized membrane protein
MIAGSYYMALKAAHLAAVFTWLSGTLLAAWTLRVGQPGATLDPAARRFVLSVLRWNRFVTTPALALAWLLGLTLARLGEWPPAPWLLAKVVLALALAGLHGYFTGKLRKAVASAANEGSPLLSIAVLVLAACAIGLAVIKPR